MPLRAGAIAAWLVWAAILLGSYFTVPGDPVVFWDGVPSTLAFWAEALQRALLALASAIVVLVAAWGAGEPADRLLLRGIARNVVDRALFRLAMGFGLLSYAWLTLAAAGHFTAATVVVTLAAAGVIGLVQLRSLRAIGSASSTSRGNRVWTACALVAMAFGLVAALAPETEYDALWYHLWLPRKWLEAGRPIDIVEEYVSLYPLGWDLHYGVAMVLGGAVAAKLLHFACLPLVALTTWRLSRLLFPQASPGLAAALVATAPIVIWEATTAYNDLALTWYTGLAVYAVAEWSREGERRWLVTSAVLFGLAAATKHLALVAALLAGIWIVLRLIRARQRVPAAISSVALWVAIVMLIPSPWYVRAYAASGNPVFPDLYRVFGAEPVTRWSDGTERALREFKDRFGPERNAANLLRLPWDMTVHGARFGGTIGPIFLMLVPLALFSGRRARVLLACCAGYLAIWASPVSSFQMRFVIPMLPILAPVCAEGARALPWSKVMLVPLLILNLPPLVEWHEADRRGWQGWLTHAVRNLPLRVVIGAESEEQYLTGVVPSYGAWKYIDATLPDGARVLTFSGGDHLYSHRPRLWANTTAAYPIVWGLSAGQERIASERLAAHGVTHVLFDRRPLETGEIEHLAIGSERMRSCCLEKLYEDRRFALYRVRAPGTARR